MPPMLMQNDRDPAELIYERVGMKKPGVLPGFELMGNRVLIGIYERPNKTKSGIHLADTTIAEDKWQGKAALVLLKGPTAFVSDEHFDFNDQNLEPGDWVSLWVTDGKSISINGQPCRVIRDQDITMKIPAPDRVY